MPNNMNSTPTKTNDQTIPQEIHKDLMKDIVSLCNRRGFIFQSGEIYGGLQGVYDYGPLGIELKNNLKSAWWQSMLYMRDDIEGIDTSILTHKVAMQHSGHESTFSDPMVDCKDCNARMRADHLTNAQCEECGSTRLTDIRQFNLMFRTNFGPIEGSGNFAYLRPETAQGIFMNFKNVLNTTARKLPFGIAQIGKAFRNEVTARNFIFRVREFEQMELEFFVEPGTDEQWHKTWVQNRLDWWQAQGLKAEDLKLSHQDKDSLAHYSKATTDILYRFPHGFEELEGVANRTDFDLGSHSKSPQELNLYSTVLPNNDSNTKLLYNDLQQNKQFVPFVIEPSAGVDRGVLAILAAAYHKENIGEDGDSRIVLKLKPHLAPFKVAVIPLAKNNPQIVAKAKEVCQQLRMLGLGRIKYEDTGNIGKAYRRHDEIGTPYCITVDFETLEDTHKDTVTIRDRDTMLQNRIAIGELDTFMRKILR